MSQAEQDARVWMDNYNVEAEKVIYKSTEAAWKYNTNLTQYNQQQSVSLSTLLSENMLFMVPRFI